METQSDSPDALLPRSAGGNSWTLPLVLAASLAITAMLLMGFRQEFGDGPHAGGSEEAKPSWSRPPDAQTETVALKIDFGNAAAREFTALPWRQGMTVADLMTEAAKFSPGIRYSQQGEGAMALLTSLDGVANGTPAGRFWLYEVNGQPGTVSFAVHKLSAGDRVLWAFKPPE